MKSHPRFNVSSLKDFGGRPPGLHARHYGMHALVQAGCHGGAARVAPSPARCPKPPHSWGA